MRMAGRRGLHVGSNRKPRLVDGECQRPFFRGNILLAAGFLPNSLVDSLRVSVAVSLLLGMMRATLMRSPFCSCWVFLMASYLTPFAGLAKAAHLEAVLTALVITAKSPLCGNQASVV
jgi:hypothetical protein